MNVEIAQRLSARRKQAGLSQEALAEQLGVSRQAVSKWERSESSPDTDNLIALAQLYGVSLDDLLYVDDEMRDDVVFEAVDRAAERVAGQGSNVAEGTAADVSAAGASAASVKSDGAASAASAQNPPYGSPPPDYAPPSTEGKKSKVQIGFGGIHVLDGDDYVHVSWRDGVHVRDSKKGEEVHVGWNGIHVKDGSGAKEGGVSESATDPAENPRPSQVPNAASSSAETHESAADFATESPESTRGNWRAAAEAWASADDRREGERRAAQAWYGSNEQSSSAANSSGTTEWSGATSNGVSGHDDEGNAVVIDSDGVVINGERFDSWKEAHNRYGYGHFHDDRWWEPCAYTVNGERFNNLDDARAKYGEGVGTSIPVRKHYLREFEKAWVKFPYPLVVIIVYLLLGVLNGAWGMGLFLFFTIPVYYMVGHAVGRRQIAPLISGTYPLGVTAWFCYMAFVMNAPHPAWVMFLTIPLVEWLVHSLKRWWRSRKRAKAANKTAPIEVEPK